MFLSLLGDCSIRVSCLCLFHMFGFALYPLSCYCVCFTVIFVLCCFCYCTGVVLFIVVFVLKQGGTALADCCEFKLQTNQSAIILSVLSNHKRFVLQWSATCIPSFNLFLSVFYTLQACMTKKLHLQFLKIAYNFLAFLQDNVL